MRELFACLSVVGLCVSAGLADGARLQKLGLAKQVLPTKIGHLGPDQTVSEWVEYVVGRQECDWRLIFDCFEPDVGDHCPAPNGDGYDGEPIGFGTCSYWGEPEYDDCDSQRWCLGNDWCNMYCSNDMQFDPAYGGKSAERIEVAWYWYVDGPGSGENMALLTETFEDFDDTCEEGDPNHQGEFLGGVLVTFGFYNGDPGGYYYADIDLCGLEGVPLPADGAGSYNIWLLTYVGDNPDYPEDFSLATCAQPMLWGTGDAEWPPPGDDVGRGRMSHQGPMQWDDDYPSDGWHTAPDECYDYTYSFCPDPLGATLCFWVAVECVGDIDGDDDTDETDLGIFLAAWDSSAGDPNWDSRPDLNFDGHVDQADLGILLANWGCGVGK